MADYEKTVQLGHGSGGTMSHEIVQQVFLKHLRDPLLLALEDGAVLDDQRWLEPSDGRIAFTTDSYVVRPLVFPGGDIGKLAVCGTVNDLAMRGAIPRFMSVGYILEEGLSLQTLDRVVASMAQTAQAAGVRIVTGDTKVVDRGSADGVFINTAGIGTVPSGIEISATRAVAGDVILVSGAMGDHGLTIMTQREGLMFGGSLQSDCRPLASLVQVMLRCCPDIHVLRDPTRGGLASALNEVAEQSNVGIEINELAVPVHDAVRAASELLGLDPLYVANEGKLMAIVPDKHAQRVLGAMREHPDGAEAAVIGRVVASNPGRVVVETLLGTRRIVDMLAGEQLPRIC